MHRIQYSTPCAFKANFKQFGMGGLATQWLPRSFIFGTRVYPCVQLKQPFTYNIGRQFGY